eukprot:CAMPEP_0114614694 /NCGR_PEP_ID=MMETSP0168-20121206/5785_1 /TAXON_ID=95228 ORGANISM="Vannella sp., Strain DIVA3 517/6/12" /NCGR_SAMPLE_ID=MMETSP0168 /ASSEMBLY_ACC=CAM_ASM_000044 /LENGTH=352 /DNA_ID=CAMNT_0001825749 /DNA_START=43 /DNA_END=1097 /DNA_ORIENTATION=+
MGRQALVCVLVVALVLVAQCSGDRLWVGVDSPAVAVEGRAVMQDSGDGSYLAYDWSGVNVKIVVTNTATVEVRLKDKNNFYNVFVDGKGTPIHVIEATDGDNVQAYSLFPEGYELLLDRHYVIMLTKRTEAQNNSNGPAEVFGFTLDEGGAALPPPWEPPSRHMEFLGDSITCGYGNLVNTTSCTDPQGIIEDNWLTYDQMLARYFNAAVHVESWSGIGLVRNYGDVNQTSKDPFPTYWNRTIAVEPTPVYDFSLFVPDLVVVNLGTNDFSTQPNPTREQFESGYYEFIARIRTAYGEDLPMFLVCGPMIGDPCCTYVQEVVSNVSNAYYVDLQDILVDGEYGCGGHPNVAG